MADSNNDNVAGNTLQLYVGVDWTRTSPGIDRTDDLRFSPESGHITFGICFNVMRSLQAVQLSALSNSAFDFLGQRCHVVLTTAVGDDNLFGTETDGAAGAVHSNVAAADNDNGFILKVRHFFLTDVAQHFYRTDNTVGILAFNTDFLVGVSTDGNINCVKFLTQLFKGDITLLVADSGVEMYFYAGGQNSVQILLQTFTREAVGRNAVAQHAAELALFFKHNSMMAHQLQIVGCGHTAGAATDDGDTFVGSRLLFGQRNGVAGRIVNSHTLQTTDIDRSINHAAAAACFTGMLADKTAGSREGVILADELDSVGITACANQRNVAGDINLCRAQSYAGDRMMDVDRAFALLYVVNVIFAEAFQTGQNHFGCFEADGAVSAVGNVLRGAFD